jgi:uncharacterized protein (TIGR03000 family)
VAATVNGHASPGINRAAVTNHGALVARNNTFRRHQIAAAVGCGAFPGFGFGWWNCCTPFWGYGGWGCHHNSWCWALSAFTGWGWGGWSCWPAYYYVPYYYSYDVPWYYGGNYLDTLDLLSEPDLTAPGQYQRAPEKAREPEKKGPEKLPPPKPDSAKLFFTLPDADAVVWLDDYLTRTAGQQREYETPLLQPNKTYAYHLTVVWEKDGQAFRDDRKLELTAGGTITVDYTKPAAASDVSSQ